jgi:hypothetical protein
MPENKKAFMIGSGIGSLAAAAFMIRDGGILRRLAQGILMRTKFCSLGRDSDPLWT